MAFELSIETKIKLFRVQLKQTDDYNPHIKHLLPVLRKLYISILTKQEETVYPSYCLEQLEVLMEDVQQRLKKQHNYKAVIKQVKFV